MRSCLSDMPLWRCLNTEITDFRPVLYSIISHASVGVKVTLKYLACLILSICSIGLAVVKQTLNGMRQSSLRLNLLISKMNPSHLMNSTHIGLFHSSML